MYFKSILPIAIMFCVSLSSVLSLGLQEAKAHGGGLNSEGCHNDRKRGGYHCHRQGYSPRYRGNVGPVPLLSTPQLVPQPHRQQKQSAQNIAPAQVTSAQLIYTVQVLLIELGYRPGKADGLIGASTQTAVKQYQSDTFRPVTGTVDGNLLVQLARSVHQKRTN